MRALVDLVDSLSGTVRFFIFAIMLGGIAITVVMTAGVSYVAPKVAADYGERAERFGERAIAAAREEARAQELARDGWGYDNSQSAGSQRTGDAYGGSDRDGSGGWGSETN